MTATQPTWDVESVAAELLSCESERREREPFTDDWPELGLATGYQIQDLNLAKRLARGEHLIGVKLGLTSRAKQQRMGVDTPSVAWLTDDMILPVGDPVPQSKLIHPRIEPEIVFVMGHKLEGPGVTCASYTVRSPRGVIAVVCAWNLPLLMTWKVGPALACGNTVVVKPSEETPSTATLLGEVMNKVGVPKGVYNVVHGFGPDSAGAFLTGHPDANGITFTGETRTGTAIMKAGAEGIRPVSLELGGKNAALVFADCDFDLAVNTVTRSAFENAGQVCLGTERVYVERPIFDKFVTALKAKAEGMTPGRPEDPATKIGPLVSKEHQDKVYTELRNVMVNY